VVFRQKASEAFAPLTTIATIIQLASVATVAVTAVLATLFARTVVRPLRALGNAATEIGAGNLGVSLPPAGNDEVGELTTQFANMSNQLQKTVGELQQRTLVIETSSEVSRHLSTILDEQELMTTVVNQVRRGFNYYHAHIYLLNQSEDTLIMVAGTGQPAQEMLAQKHRIRLGEGLVGRAAETKETVLVSDVRQDPNWLPNALLPETKSEVAVPIIVGGQLLGVLDVQHNIINGLQGQDADLLELLANQIGIALQNARLFTQTQQQARQQALINEIGRKIQTAPTVERVLQTAAEELGEALGTQRTTVMLNSRGRTNGRN
jgi:putative methionine-R-sulfoxide reductase with GAF domain